MSTLLEKRAGRFVMLTWGEAHRMLDAATERGLYRRDSEHVPHVGIDEKTLGHGNDYVVPAQLNY